MIKNIIKILLVTVFLIFSVPVNMYAEVDSESDLSDSGLEETITTTDARTTNVSTNILTCENIGGANEGWYKGTELMLLDDCGGLEAVCSFEGTRDEGWYNTVSNELIVLDICSTQEESNEDDSREDDSEEETDKEESNEEETEETDETESTENDTESDSTTESETESEEVNEEISNSDSEILSNPFGAEMRLLQLKKRVEFQIEGGELILDRINNANKSEQFDMEKLEEIILGFEGIIDSIENFDFTATPEEMAEEYVALKKEAISLTKQFREEVRNGLSEEDKKQLREAIKKNHLIRKEIKDKRIEELRAKYNAKKTQEILERIGENRPELIAKIESGELSLEEIREKLNANYAKLNEERKEKAKAKLEEEKKKLQIKAQERRAELEAKSQERREELKAKTQERREELKAKAQERRAELEAKTQERRAELEAKAQERRAEFEAKNKERLNADDKENEENGSDDDSDSDENMSSDGR